MRQFWNIPSLPVFSLATYSKPISHPTSVNMNICTFVNKVSIVPKRYSVAVYHNTKTLNNLDENPNSVLQLLCENQINLVRTLGKKSGWDYDKSKFLIDRKLLIDWKGLPVLSGAIAYAYLKAIDKMNAGDHTIYLFDVLHFTKSDRKDYLTIHHIY
ncbi:MAG: flavin reductase family protein [Candidatus Kapabacteria bacterium]|nr:flavin reductase family protein [Ignavibacteriota bacterium]MCW5884216.1 flavin reductase family protein [Candidatus Kapabacteria bacterium]